MIGVTVAHEETDAPLGDQAPPDPVEGSVAPDANGAAPSDGERGPDSDESGLGVDTPDTAVVGALDELDEVVAEAADEGIGGDELDEEDDDDEPFVVSPYDQPGRWFVVHTYAGYENKVKSNLHSRAVSMNMEDRIYEVVIPMEDVVEFKNGKKVVVQKKVFPGYLLCRCELDDDSWSVIRNTPGVTGFVGPGTKPTPLSRREVEGILQVKVEGAEAPSKRTGT